MVILALGLATMFHPGKKGSFFFTLQMFVSFTIFLEAFAMVPQLVHLHISQDTEGLNSYYLYCLAAARIGRVLFWNVMSTKRDSFWYLISADIIHTILLIAFCVMYRRAKTGTKTVLGTTVRDGKSD